MIWYLASSIVIWHRPELVITERFPVHLLGIGMFVLVFVCTRTIKSKSIISPSICAFTSYNTVRYTSDSTSCSLRSAVCFSFLTFWNGRRHHHHQHHHQVRTLLYILTFTRMYFMRQADFFPLGTRFSIYSTHAVLTKLSFHHHWSAVR